MSKSVNKVILVGNLTRDPEMRYTGTQTAIAKLGIATNESRKDQESGEWRDFPEYHNVTYFGKLAEIVEKYLKKGAKIYVEGRLRTSKYEDKKNPGVTKYSTEVIGSELLMLGGRQEGQQSNDSSQSSTSDNPFPEDDSGPGLTDDDVPF